MLMPVIFAWMEERDRLTACRVNRLGLDKFDVVAALTSQCQVISRGLATENFGDDVFVGMSLRSVRFRTHAVFAVPKSARSDQSL